MVACTLATSLHPPPKMDHHGGDVADVGLFVVKVVVVAAKVAKMYLST